MLCFPQRTWTAEVNGMNTKLQGENVPAIKTTHIIDHLKETNVTEDSDDEVVLTAYLTRLSTEKYESKCWTYCSCGLELEIINLQTGLPLKTRANGTNVRNLEPSAK
jgi:hypothetical protein